MKKYKSLIIILSICIASFLLDMISKNIANNILVEYEKNEVIHSFFYFTLCYNTGGAWSILSGNISFLILTSIVALIAVIYTIFNSKTNFYKYSSALFIGGLVGNLFDRIFYGKVIDFLDFVIFGYDFPVFNLADCFICVGVALMIIALIREEKKYGKDDI